MRVTSQDEVAYQFLDMIHKKEQEYSMISIIDELKSLLVEASKWFDSYWDIIDDETGELDSLRERIKDILK
jgi:hypothetical protein